MLRRIGNHVGYSRWADTSVDTSDPDYGYPCGRDFYERPDGSAEIVTFSRDVRDGYYDGTRIGRTKRWYDQSRHGRSDAWRHEVVIDGRWDTASVILDAGTWERITPTTTTFGS